MAEKQTFGMQRVRVSFNPSVSAPVDRIKIDTATLIDLLEDMKLALMRGGAAPPETMRLIALAQTAYEEAAMWAVKAATAT